MPNIEKIENKVPPTLIAAIAGIIIWLASSPRTGKSLLEIVAFNSLLPLAACSAGLLLIASAVLLFRDHGATLDPINLDKPTRLVTKGAYRFSRNPMYLGLALLLLAEILLLGVYWAIIFVPAFLAYVHRFQVIPEERALSARFGQDYQNYQQKTKRWL